MLTERQLMALPIGVWMAFRKMEQSAIERICGRIGEIGAGGKPTHAQTRADVREMRREISRTLSEAEGAVYGLLLGAAVSEYGDSMQLRNLVEMISRAALSDMRNMAHTMGFVNTAMGNGRIGAQFVPLSEYYQDAIDYAALQVRTGQADFYSAMRGVIRDMADNGLRTVDYASGYHRRMDTAVRANIMDAQARLSMEYAGIIGEQFGADGMEVTYHTAPRPSHEWIGGEQFDRQTFELSVRPIMGEPNCYHRAHPIILGISPPTYSPDELAALKAKDAETHEWNGKQYNAYEAQQMQRRYETSIRKHKDRAMAYKAAGDMQQAHTSSARARATQGEYRRFSDAMGMTVSAERARVSGYGYVGAQSPSTQRQIHAIINWDPKQLGKKFGKHAEDWGLDPANADDRARLKGIAQAITSGASERRRVTWRGYAKPLIAYRKGNDVVLLEENGDFVTILRGGINNNRFKEGVRL